MKGNIKTYIALALVLALLFVTPSKYSVSVRNIHGCNITGVPKYNWGTFWDHFYDAKPDLEKELKLVCNLGLNLVEIYIPYHCFPDLNYVKLKEFMRIAKKYGLMVIVTLNDDVYPDNVNYTYIELHMKAIIDAIGSMSNLFAFGVMNEYNGRFGTNMSFAKWCISKLRELTSKPIVFDLVYFWHMPWQIYVGLDVDYYSFSIYSIPPFDFAAETFDELLASAEKVLGKPVFLGEFGWRTDGEDPSYTEEKQAEYYRKVLGEVHGKYGWLFWCFTDWVELDEQWGVYTVNFEPKPVVEVIREVLS
ncbi:hypothetical protein DRO69_00480 [Candidatus Bathyarchaeota archaeon]|nr:MAG: hypothetical protein DRO69_00480 [Candidatus Bathyarchaeota archaeon]